MTGTKLIAKKRDGTKFRFCLFSISWKELKLRQSVARQELKLTRIKSKMCEVVADEGGSSAKWKKNSFEMNKAVSDEEQENTNIKAEKSSSVCWSTGLPTYRSADLPVGG